MKIHIKLLLLAVVIGVMLIPVSAKAAEPPCEATVADLTTSHVLGGQAATRAAASKLEADQGAKVHVVALQSTTEPLAQFYARMVKRCPPWQGPSRGLPAANLVALIIRFEPKHKQTLYYGSDWRKALDGQSEGIESDMAKLFRAEKFDQGFAKGLSEIGERIHTQEHPPKKVDWWKFFLYIVIGAAVVVLLFLLIDWRDRRKKYERRRVIAQKRAEDVYGSVTSEAELLARTALATGNLVNEVTKLAGARAAESLGESWSKADHQVEKATEGYNRITGNPRNPKLSRERYEDIAAEFKEAYQGIKAALTEVEAVDRAAKELKRRVEDAGPSLERQAGALAQLYIDLKGETEAGYQCGGAETALKEAETHLSHAKQALEHEDHSAVLHGLEAAEGILETAAEAIKKPARMQGQLTRKQEQLEDELSQAERDLQAAEQTLSALHVEYSSDALTDGESKLQEAGVRLRAIKQRLPQVKDKFSMENQEWDEAAEAQEVVSGDLSFIDDAVSSLKALASGLKTAKENAVRKATQVDDGIRRALASLEKLEGQGEGAHAELVRLQAESESIKGRMSQPRPDYIELLQQIDSVQAQAEEVLSDFRREYEPRVQHYYRQQGRWYRPQEVDPFGFGGFQDLAFLEMLGGNTQVGEELLGVSLLAGDGGSPLMTLAGLELLDSGMEQGGGYGGSSDSGWSGSEEGGGLGDFDDFGGGGGSESGFGGEEFGGGSESSF